MELPPNPFAAGTTLAVGVAARPLEVAKREILRACGPWLPPSTVRGMGADFEAYEDLQIKWNDYYWAGDPTYSSERHWYGSPVTAKYVVGGQGGGTYYDGPAQYYVMWARTGEQRFLDRANAMIQDLKDNCFNQQYQFTVSATVGGPTVSLSGTATGNATVTNPIRGSELVHSYDFAGNFITWYENKLKPGDPVVFSTTGNLPTGLTAGVTYYVKDIVRNNWGAAGGVIQWNMRGVYCHWLVTGDPTDVLCMGHFASAATSAYYKDDIVGGNTAATSLQPGGFDGLGHNASDQRTWARLLETMIFAYLMQAPTIPEKTGTDVSAGPSIWKGYVTSYMEGVLAGQDDTGGWRFVFTHGNQSSIGYEKPYQTGMIHEALITYYNLIDPDPRIPDAIQASCDCIWNTCFVTSAAYPASALGVTSQVERYSGQTMTNVFRYLEGSSVFEPTDDGAGTFLGTSLAPNLNLMSVNGFGFVYQTKGLQLYKDRGDKIWAGAIQYGYGAVTTPQNNAQKSMRELYGWSWRYPYYRSFALSFVADTTPGAFTLTDVSGATLSTVYTSNTITVVGINTPTAISITGGTYSINGGSYVSTTGSVNAGDTVSVRVTSSASNSTAVNAVLTIGGVSDTYTVTTVGVAGSSLTYTRTGTPEVVDAAFSGPANFAAQAIGSPAADRRVIATLSVNSLDALIGVTIGGVTASIDVISVGNPYQVIASAIVPTGTTAAVVVSNTGNPNSLGPVSCVLGTVYGANATAWVATSGVAEFSYSEASVGPLTVPTGGVAVIGVSANWNAVTLGGTGVVTDFSFDAASNGAPCFVYGHATATFTATTANSAGNGTSMVACVYKV